MPLDHSDLLPCPFCGREAHYEPPNIACQSCGCRLPWCKEFWNHRAPPDAIRAEPVAWLIEGLDVPHTWWKLDAGSVWSGAWTNDANKATRFTTKFDALEVADRAIKKGHFLITEHAWVDKRCPLCHGLSQRQAGTIETLRTDLADMEANAEAYKAQLDGVAKLCRTETEARITAETSLARLQAECDAVVRAIPGVRYMDPPDGGSVTIAEQVARMVEHISRLESESTWRCFHCGEVFTDWGKARNHFGWTPADGKPTCTFSDSDVYHLKRRVEVLCDEGNKLRLLLREAEAALARTAPAQEK